MFGVHSFAGTAGNYASMMKLRSLWDTKKDKSNYTEKADPNEDPLIRHLNEMREQNQQNSGKEAILTKLRSGKKLTQEEMEYLQREDPAAYQKAREIQAEQNGYRNALKNCRTKEDVQRLKATHVGAALTRVNAIANDPHIPKGKKMELLLHENAKLEAVRKEEQEFIASGAYDRLPTDAEQKEAMKQDAKTRKEDAGTPRPTEDPAEIPPASHPAEKEPEDAATTESVPGSGQSAAENQETGRSQASGTPDQEKASHSPETFHSQKTARPDTKAAYARGTDAYEKSPGRLPERKKGRISRNA